jgi:hypothetical protein
MIKPFLKVDYTKSTLKIWFQSNSWQTPDRLLTELFKSALQIWRAFQISSPNLVTISLPKIILTDCPNQLSKFGYHQTPDSLLTDSH